MHHQLTMICLRVGYAQPPEKGFYDPAVKPHEQLMLVELEQDPPPGEGRRFDTAIIAIATPEAIESAVVGRRMLLSITEVPDGQMGAFECHYAGPLLNEDGTYEHQSGFHEVKLAIPGADNERVYLYLKDPTLARSVRLGNFYDVALDPAPEPAQKA